jgi:hypothetical protein
LKLDRLTYVHDGDPGAIGQLIQEARGAVRFGGEGSGLIEIDRSSQAPEALMTSVVEVSVPIHAVKFSSLAPDVQHEIGEEHVPCILGHAGVQTVLLLPRRSLSRVTGGLSDLRGKIRFGLARIGWQL